MNNLRVVIITGLSGSGKSTASGRWRILGSSASITCLSFFFPDSSRFSPMREDITKVAMVMDLREKSFLEKYTKIFDQLKSEGHRIEILFLDSSDDALLHRFSETKGASHFRKGSVMEASIWRGRSWPFETDGDKVIDTTSYNVHQLKDVVQRQFVSYP